MISGSSVVLLGIGAGRGAGRGRGLSSSEIPEWKYFEVRIYRRAGIGRHGARRRARW